MTLPPEAIAAVETYERDVQVAAALSASLTRCNDRIALVKEQAAAANVAALTANLSRLRAVKARHSAPLKLACDAYVAEKEAKVRTENLRDRARRDLEEYRNNLFPRSQDSINHYLGRFNAGFRIGDFGPVNTKAGSSATYKVVINNRSVSLAGANGGPSFRTTLSAGDRNTLALAFFFHPWSKIPTSLTRLLS